LLSALALGEPGLDAMLFFAAAVAAYLTHEPLLVLRGTRGERRRREQRSRAWLWLGGWGVLAATLGAAALALAEPHARYVAAVPLILAALAVTHALRGAERTLWGELLAGAALVSASLPVAVAASTSVRDAALVALLWLTSFSLMTLAVRGVARVRFDAGASLRVARRGLSAALLLALALLAGGLLPAWALLVLVPTWLAGSLLTFKPPPPREMRRVGWSLIGTSVLTLALLLVSAG
jgi:hypothetical protein